MDFRNERRQELLPFLVHLNLQHRKKEYEKEKKHNNTAYSTDYEISLTWFGVALHHPTITRVPAQWRKEYIDQWKCYEKNSEAQHNRQLLYQIYAWAEPHLSLGGFGFSASYMETPNIIPNPPPMAMLSKTMEIKTQHPFQSFNICTPIRDFSFEGA